MSSNFYIASHALWDSDLSGNIGSATGSALLRPRNVYMGGYIELAEIASPAAANSGTNRLYFNSTDHLLHYVNSSAVDSAIGVTSFPLLAPDGSSSAPSYAFSSESGTGIFRGGASQLDIALGGNDCVSFHNSGYLYINFANASLNQMRMSYGSGGSLVLQSSAGSGAILSADSGLTNYVQMQSTGFFLHSADLLIASDGSNNIGQAANFRPANAYIKTQVTIGDTTGSNFGTLNMVGASGQQPIINFTGGAYLKSSTGLATWKGPGTVSLQMNNARTTTIQGGYGLVWGDDGGSGGGGGGLGYDLGSWARPTYIESKARIGINNSTSTTYMGGGNLSIVGGTLALPGSAITTSVNASTSVTVTNGGATVQQLPYNLGVGDYVYLTGLAGTIARVTAISSSTAFTTDIAIGDGTSRVLNILPPLAIFTNSSGVESITIRYDGVSLYNKDIIGLTDGSFNIGANLANRVNNIYAKGTIYVGGDGQTIYSDPAFNDLHISSSASTGKTGTPGIRFDSAGTLRAILDVNGVTLQSTSGILWQTDGGGSIGGNLANRPARVNVQHRVIVGTPAGGSGDEGVFVGSASSTVSCTMSGVAAYAGFNFGDASNTYGIRQLAADTTGVLSIVDTSSVKQFIFDTNNKTLTLNGTSGANLLWGTDGGGNIGSSGANRPNNLFLASNATVGGVINAANGTVSAPSVNLGDSGTGPYRSALNEITIANNGSNTFKFYANGQVDTMGHLINFDSGAGGMKIGPTSGRLYVVNSGGRINLFTSQDGSTGAGSQIDSSGFFQIQGTKFQIQNIANTVSINTYPNLVSTTDATVTTVQTLATSSNTSCLYDIKVIGRRTGGSAGTANDTGVYKLLIKAKNVAGTVTVTEVSRNENEDQPAWDCSANISGTSVLIQVTGALNNNINWISVVEEQVV